MAMTSEDNRPEESPEKMSRRDELEALLPFYLNGTLDGEDLVAVEDWLASDTAAMTALAEVEAEFSSTAAANQAIRPPADALSHFSRALDAEAGREHPAAPSVLSRLWAGFMAIPAGVAWAAATAAVVLVLVQAVMEPGGRGGPVEIAGTEARDMPFALVTFKPDARIADISAVLADQGAVILSGPAAGGVFKIGIPAKTAADYERVVGLIAAQPFADTVSAGRKPANGG
jgi:anti-sigma-K factor RskA